jgi:hypothetical protein
MAKNESLHTFVSKRNAHTLHTDFKQYLEAQNFQHKDPANAQKTTIQTITQDFNQTNNCTKLDDDPLFFNCSSPPYLHAYDERCYKRGWGEWLQNGNM